ncbi:VCBS repeat-containing protein [Streptomyces sp. AV19]|uniref:FG-GAP-like repeat-containing protein n=1 Tax=Streptomyces sp. AV19 TaxID=2793068 RepID=UPI0018FE6813|nr:FG-GAP-like repeat-containing protein [Streptomyces sp. AV19]MBH1937948.1 VCBS repeat-containing protein [Streptomyces sp. AV19]MDG4536887.1 Ig-like domain-containing protein [Streptomyces sp. AV19]
MGALLVVSIIGGGTAAAVADTHAPRSSAAALGAGKRTATLPAPTVTGPTENVTAANARPDITGTSENGATVQVKIKHGQTSELLGSVTADKTTGKWTLTPKNPLPAGKITLAVTQTKDKKTSKAVNWPFSVPANLALPVVTSPHKAANARPDITGTSENGATVQVKIKHGQTSELLGSVTADKTTGKWTLTPKNPLPAGKITLAVTQTKDKDTSNAASWSVTVPAKLKEPKVTSPAKDAKVPTARPVIEGTDGVKGATVQVKIKNGQTVGTVKVGKKGHWTLTPKHPLPAGKITLTVTQTKGNDTSKAVELPFTVPTNKPVNPWDMDEVVLADVDGDHRADVLAKPTSDSGLYWFKGNGNKTYKQGVKIFDSWDYTQTVAADFDGDGKTDLVAVDKSGNLMLWRGEGGGKFASPTLLTKWGGKEQTTAGDVDGDGVADLVARDAKDGELKLWRGQKIKGGNPFAKPLALTKWSGFAQTTISDVDGDGKADLIAMDTNHLLKYWKSDGNAKDNPFRKPITLTKWAGFTHTTAGDINGDHKFDLIAVDTNKGQLKNWTSNGKTEGNPFSKPTVVKLTYFKN